MKKRQLTKLQYWLIYAGVAVFAVVFDQLTKFLLEEPLAGQTKIPIIGNWLTLKWALNPGSAFGMFEGETVLFFIFFLIGIPLFLFLMNYSRKRSVWGQIGFSFMLGGAVGNAIDRLFLGKGFYDGFVRDFIRVENFAIFNIADSFLVVGTIFACLALLFFDDDSIFSPLFKKKTVATEEKETIGLPEGEAYADELTTTENPDVVVSETPFMEENDGLDASDDVLPIEEDTSDEFLSDDGLPVSDNEE